MSKLASASATAKKVSASGLLDAPTELVCLALALALLVLGSRIASVW
jgi:hypothetical protein